MQDITRDAYLEALTLNADIEDPSLDQILAVCPHLSREQVEELIGSQDSVYLALPPLKLRYSFRMALFTTANGTARFISTVDVARPAASYLDGHAHGGLVCNPPFIGAAMAYADAHWPQSLVLDTWADVLMDIIQDPVALTVVGMPTTVAVAYVCIRRPWSELTAADAMPLPLSQAWDDAIQIATVEPLEAAELFGYRAPLRLFHCARCGGGLLRGFCVNCQAAFHDFGVRPGTYCPLPPKLVRLLQDSGHDLLPGRAQIPEPVPVS